MEQVIKDYQVLINCKDKEIALLKVKLENFESLQRAKCCECEREAIQDLSEMHFKMTPFRDDYFKGLGTKEIAELAKKSIRLTTENSELIALLDEVYNCENINRKLRDKMKKHLLIYFF